MDTNSDETDKSSPDQEEPTPYDDQDEAQSPEEAAREMAAISEEISQRRRRRMFVAIFLILAITWLLGQLGDPFAPPNQ